METNDEHQRDIEEGKRRFVAVMGVMAEIKRLHKGQNVKGVVDCPECGGRLHFTHAASNGHVWGSCETKGCLRWME